MNQSYRSLKENIGLSVQLYSSSNITAASQKTAKKIINKVKEGSNWLDAFRGCINYETFKTPFGKEGHKRATISTLINMKALTYEQGFKLGQGRKAI